MLVYYQFYRFKDSPMRWVKAKEYCHRLGAKLVEIDSPEENEAIVDEIKKHSWSKEKKQFWMGLTDFFENKLNNKNENSRSDRQAARGFLCS